MARHEDKINILIFGKNGQIGSNLIKNFADDQAFEVCAYSSQDVDFTDLKSLTDFLYNLKKIPHFIINAAAYTDVEKAESQREICDLINNQAVQVIANYAFEKNVKLIQYSTEYIFDGHGDKPYKEDNIKNLRPLNFYGETKLRCERAIIDSGCWYLILRISWVYDEIGKNFFNKIAQLANEKEIIQVVDDQIGSPTAANFVAQNSLKIVKLVQKNDNKITKGIYHLNNNKFLSWYQFALQIVESLKKSGKILKVKKIIPVKSDEYKTQAKRPLNCRLDGQKLRELINLE